MNLLVRIPYSYHAYACELLLEIMLLFSILVGKGLVEYLVLNQFCLSYFIGLSVFLPCLFDGTSSRPFCDNQIATYCFRNKWLKLRIGLCSSRITRSPSTWTSTGRTRGWPSPTTTVTAWHWPGTSRRRSGCPTPSSPTTSTRSCTTWRRRTRWCGCMATATSPTEWGTSVLEFARHSPSNIKITAIVTVLRAQICFERHPRSRSKVWKIVVCVCPRTEIFSCLRSCCISLSEDKELKAARQSEQSTRKYVGRKERLKPISKLGCNCRNKDKRKI